MASPAYSPFCKVLTRFLMRKNVACPSAVRALSGALPARLPPQAPPSPPPAANRRTGIAGSAPAAAGRLRRHSRLRGCGARLRNASLEWRVESLQEVIDFARAGQRQKSLQDDDDDNDD